MAVQGPGAATQAVYENYSVAARNNIVANEIKGAYITTARRAARFAWRWCKGRAGGAAIEAIAL